MELMTLSLLFAAYTDTFSLPKGLLSGLCYVESRHKVSAVHKDDGNSSSLGVCQIKLSTARLLGFKGTEKELMKPKNNVWYAGQYLKNQLKRYNGDINKAVAAYNSGSYKANKIGLPVNQNYVSKVFAAWAKKL